MNRISSRLTPPVSRPKPRASRPKPHARRIRVEWSDSPRRTQHASLGRRVTYVGRVAGDEVLKIERFPESGYSDWTVIVCLGEEVVIDRRRTRRAAQKAGERFLRWKLAIQKGERMTAEG